MKKLISLLLSVFVIASCVATVGFALDAEAVYDESYENALKLVTSVNKDFSVDLAKDDIITRGDFVRLALGLYGIKFTKTQSVFEDIPEDLSPFIAYALDNGMIDSGVRFYPDNNLSYDMAIRIAVVMAGYTPKALNGGYSAAAKSASLLKGTDGSEMTVRNAVILLSNVLNANVMEQSVFGDVSEYTVSEKTFLEFYHNVVYCEGLVTANMYTSLTSVNGACADNRILIGTEEFVSADSEYLGYNVRAYYYKDNKKILALYKTENNYHSSNDVSGISGNSVSYYDADEKEVKIKLDPSYQFIYNGRAYMHAGFENIFSTCNGNFEFIDNNGDKLYDVVFAWDYKFMQVKYVDFYNWRVFDANNDAIIDLSGDDCKYEVFYKYKYVEEKAELTDISEGAILTYCLSKDGKYCRFYITEENVTGQITEVNKNEKLVKIGDAFYNYNEYFEKYYSDYIGKGGTFNISYDGKIMSASGAGSGSLVYGWMDAVGRDTTGLDKKVYLKLYTQDGKLSVFEVAEKVVVDGAKITCEEAYNDVLLAYSQGSVYDRLIKYSLNEEGLLYTIDTASVAENVADIRSTKSDNNKLTKYYHDKYAYLNSTTSFGKQFRMTASTKIFFIPGTEEARSEEKNFSCDTYSSFFEDFESYTVAAYDISKTGVASAVVYSSTDTSTSSANLATSALFIKARTVYYPDLGETKRVYDIFQGGAYKSCTAYTADVEAVMDTASPGDILRISRNSQDEIMGAILDYDVSSFSFVSTPSDKNRVEYFQGYLDNYDGSNMNLVMNMTATDINEVAIKDYYHINTSRGSEVFVNVIKDRNGNIVSVEPNFIDRSSILGFSDVGTGADRVVIRRRAEAPGLAVVYRFITR